MSLPNLCKLARTATVHRNKAELIDLAGKDEVTYRFRGVEYQLIETRLNDQIFNKCRLKTAKALVDILANFWSGESLENLLKMQTSYWIVTVGDCRLFVSGHWKVYNNDLSIELTSVHMQPLVYDANDKLATSWESIPDVDAYTESIEIGWKTFKHKQSFV